MRWMPMAITPGPHLLTYLDCSCQLHVLQSIMCRAQDALPMTKNCNNRSNIIVCQLLAGQLPCRVAASCKLQAGWLPVPSGRQPQ